MKLVVKYFDDLTTKELYELLKARISIFVLEQNRVYQDLDDKDYHSLHVFFEDNGEVVACLRAFLKEDNVVQIGRVLTLYHGNGLGGKLLKEGIVQSYATGFYEREGFKICSEEFLKDGIPHVAMDLKL